MIDRYTKTVLTVIAVALSLLAIQGLIPAANAQSDEAFCGTTKRNACFVRTDNDGRVTVTANDPLPVQVRQ